MTMLFFRLSYLLRHSLLSILTVTLLLIVVVTTGSWAQLSCGGFDGSVSATGGLQSVSNGQVCLNKAGALAEIRFVASNIADDSNPNNFAVEIDWDDGSPAEIIAYTIGGVVLVTGPHAYEIPSVTHVFLPRPCAASPGGAECAYRPKVYLRMGGSTCSTPFGTSPDFFRYNTDDQCPGTMTLTETTTNANLYLANPGESITFTDRTTLNCLPPNELTSQNGSKRWRQFVYGTTNSMTGTVLINGAPTVFPYTPTAMPEVSAEPLTTSGTPFAANNTRVITIPMTAAPGEEFYVRMDYWNFCNQYGTDPAVAVFGIIRVAGLLAQTITFNTVPAVTYGDSPFALSATASSGLAVTYTSSNTNVATVSANTVTVVGAGTTTITAYQTGDGVYMAATPVPQDLTVNKAVLGVQADNASRVYGDVNPTLGVTYSGFINAETSAVLDTAPSSTTAATITSSVGPYSVIPAGGADDNYSFTYTNGSLTIDKAPLTVTADNKSREYGMPNATLTMAYAGLKNSETSAVVDTAPLANTSATINSNVGAYSIVPSGGLDDNYAFTYANGSLTITKANLTATAENKSRQYGLANPAFSITWSGFRNSETSAVIDTAPLTNTAATQTSNVGTYNIVPGGGSDDNYAFTYVNGSLTITKAPLTVVADNKSREYGSPNPTFSISITGLRNSENTSVIDAAPAANTTATLSSNVGTYNIVPAGASDNNYSFAYVTGTLTITKTVLTVTTENKSREYASPNPTLAFLISGFKNGETAAVIDVAPATSTTATTSSSAGVYPIVPAGASDNNYSFSYTNGMLTITKAALTVTADNKSRGYGVANPSFTIVFTGFKNSETSAVINTIPIAATTAVTTSPVGTYPITVVGGSDDNYSFTYVSGTLTIGKSPQTITFSTLTNLSETAGTFTVVATASSGLPVLFSSANVDHVSVTGNVVTILSAGSVTITASQAGDNEYEAASSTVQTICINPAKPTVATSGLDSNTPVLTSSASAGNLWHRNGMPIAGATTSSFSPTMEGSYEVKVTVDGCASPMSDETDIIITAIETIPEVYLEVYPNPVQTELKVVLPGSAADAYVLTVYNLSGGIIESRSVNAGQQVLPIAAYPAGQYLLRAVGKKKTLSARFVKP